MNPSEGCASLVCVSLTLPFHFSTMKLFTGLVFCSLVLGVNSWLSFMTEAAQGKINGGGWHPRTLGFSPSARKA